MASPPRPADSALNAASAKEWLSAGPRGHADAGKGDEGPIRDAGARGYLAKPVSIEPFMAAVNSFIA